KRGVFVGPATAGPSLGHASPPAATMSMLYSAAASPADVPAVTDLAWLDAALSSARPRAVAALLRYFRDLDTAEEAFQEASLRALKTWPVKGPPRDPAAWLIFVGRNSALDDKRRRSKEQELPSDEVLSDDDDAQSTLADQ